MNSKIEILNPRYCINWGPRSYEDSNPLLDICVQAQQWYTQQSLPTKVKACATVGVDELLQLAGVDALTIVPDDLRALKSINRSEIEVNELSLFGAAMSFQEKLAYPSYKDDEAKYRLDFDHVDDGKAQFKLSQVRFLPPNELEPPADST
jgi:transaldolase